jgi:hypothetical protein
VKKLIKLNHIFLFVLVLAQGSSELFAQGMYTQFGQNRVQDTKFTWSFVRSENFDAYFYSGGRELATFAARTAEEQLNNLEKIIDNVIYYFF